MTQPTLILASGSLYRRELLARLQLTFSAHSPNINETRLPNESAVELVKRLAAAKADALAAKFPNALIIGCDQVASLDEQILGKAGNYSDAMTQLQRCNGRTVIFYTGLCLLDVHKNQHQIDVVAVSVTYRTLTDEEIDYYLCMERPYDTCGSFKSEGLGIALTERIDSNDPTALIGLPLIRLTNMLKAVGVNVI